MCRYSHIANIAPTVLLAWLIAAPVFAQDTSNDGVEAWRALDEEFRQAMVEEISARRGLDANDQNPDWLIQSAEDIEEALTVSCEISGDSCAGLIGDGEELDPPPGYTAEQGFAIGEAIRRAKSGLDEQ
jgi:hypothetical protein